MKLSILVNAYNEEQNLPPFLDSLLRQTIQDFEFVIVDDGSTDRTVQIVKEYAPRFADLRLLEVPHLGLRQARERGFRAVTGDVCLILDADETLPMEDALARFLEPFADPSVAGVGAIKLPASDDNWLADGFRVTHWTVYHGRIKPDGTTEMIVGGAMAVRVQAVNQVGGLTKDPNIGEDKDISWRLRDAGWRLIARNDIVILHQDPSTVAETYRYGYKMGRREFALHAKHPKKMLFWKTWVRFYPLVVIGCLLARFRVGLALLAANYFFALWMFRKAPASPASKSKAWVVWNINNFGWNVGVFGGMLSHIFGKKIDN